MPAPEVRVIIGGDNSKLDAELAKSNTALGGFVGSATSLLKGLAASAAAVALGQFFKSALEEAGKAETGMKRLGTAVLNAGGDFRSMQPEIESIITKFVRLTKHTDDDLRAALTNMIGISGDVSGSLKNLGLATDLAAFAQIPLEDAATAVGKAMNGNVTAFNKMGIAGKDATSVLEAARQQFGGFAEGEARTFEGSVARISNEWGEFKEAVGTAMLSSGAMEEVTNLVVKALVDLQGWVVKNEDEIGALVSGIARGVTSFGQFLAKIVEFGQGMDRAAVRLNHFLISLGLDLPRAAEAGFKKTQNVEADYQKSVERMGREHTAQMTGLYAAGERDRTEAAAAGKKEREKVAKEEAEKKELLVRDTNILLTRSEEEMNKELAKQKVNWNAIAGEVEKVTTKHRELLPLPAQLSDFTIKHKKGVQELNALLEEQHGNFLQNVDGAIALARGLVEGAHAMGLLSDEGQTALSAVLGMTEAVGKIAGGDKLGGIIELVGSLANAIAGIGTSATEKARLAAFRVNSEALMRLTREVGNLNLRESGKTFAGVEDAVQKAIDARATARAAGKGPGEADKFAKEAFEKALQANGISVSEARALFKEIFGRDMAAANAGTFFQDVLALQEGLKRTEFGQFGQDFSGQFDFITKSKDVLGLTDNQQLQQFVELAKKSSPAFAKALEGVDLNTPEGRAAATKKLQALFSQLNAGTLSATDIGVSGPQFLQLIETLLPLLSSATGLAALPNLSPPAINPGGIGSGTSAIVGPRLQEAIAGLGQGQTNGASVTTITGDVINNFAITQQPGESGEHLAEHVATIVMQTMGKRYMAQLTALGVPGSATTNI